MDCSVGEEIQSGMLFVLDPAVVEPQTPDVEWPLNLPLEPTTDLNLFSEVQKIQHSSDDESEFVDVEGCFLNADDLLLPTENYQTANEPPYKNANEEYVAPKPDKVYLCAKCVQRFHTMEDCRKHMKEAHDWCAHEEKIVTAREPNNKISFTSYKRKIKIPMLKIDIRKSLAVSEIAKPVFSTEIVKGLEAKEVNVEIRQASSLSYSSQKEDIRCKICSLSFSKHEFLDKHSKCHIKGKRGFMCPECPSEYFQKWLQCTEHLWKNHEVDVQLPTCDICGSKFLKPYLLASHQMQHSGFKQFVCQNCPKSFKQLAQLKLHQLTHLPKEERPTSRECTICHRIYSDFRSLKKHMRSVHSSEKSFACSQCDFRTTGKYTLKIHERSHTGEKPHACTICDVRFSDHNSLRRHKMLHTGLKKYQCPFCRKAFIQSNGFKHHVLQKHPQQNGLVMECKTCSFKTVNAETYSLHVQRHIFDESKALDELPSLDDCSDLVDPTRDNTESLISNIDFEQLISNHQEINPPAVDMTDDNLLEHFRPNTPSILDELPAELVQVYQNTLFAE